MDTDRITVPTLVRRWSRVQPEKPFVVADDGVLTYGELDRATRLSAYKVPVRWALNADSVPTMTTGKVDTAALRRLLTDRA